MGFSNQSITPLRRTKPHIVMVAGLYRVSALSKQVMRVLPGVSHERWRKAHAHVCRLNESLIEKRQRLQHGKRTT